MLHRSDLALLKWIEFLGGNRRFVFFGGLNNALHEFLLQLQRADKFPAVITPGKLASAIKPRLMFVDMEHEVRAKHSRTDKGLQLVRQVPAGKSQARGLQCGQQCPLAALLKRG